MNLLSTINSGAAAAAGTRGGQMGQSWKRQGKMQSWKVYHTEVFRGTTVMVWEEVRSDGLALMDVCELQCKFVFSFKIQKEPKRNQNTSTFPLCVSCFATNNSNIARGERQRVINEMNVFERNIRRKNGSTKIVLCRSVMV